MSTITLYDKKQLETAAYCIGAMLRGETLSYQINASANASITCLDELNDAISRDSEITFEGGNQQRYLDFATLSDKAKGALQNMWRAGPVYVSQCKQNIIRDHGGDVYHELNKLLSR